MMNRIEIEKSLIPYEFEIALSGDVWKIGVSYNKTADIFTLSVSKDGELKLAGEPLVYNVPLFVDTYMVDRMPNLTIRPVDESGQCTNVTWENFGETVFLCIDDEG